MIKRNIKMVVTPEESKQVQEICFANGIVWEVKYKECNYTDRKFLYIDDHLTWGSLELSFKEHPNEEVDATFFIKTKGTCVEENQEQELKQNIKEEQMYFLNTEMKKKNNEHKDVKEYLVAEGLYDRVMGIEWDDEVEEYEYFSDLYLWANTEEGVFYWDEIDEDLRDLGINMNIESLVQDYKAKQEGETYEDNREKAEKYVISALNEVEETPKQSTNIKPKQYLCYVQGKALPKHIHKTLEQAKQEAQRLCRKELAKVRVLEVVVEFEAEVLVKEVL